MSTFLPRRYVSIQYLRGIAACLVVLHHARNPESWLVNPLDWLTSGQSGVDIFFVISGFTMFVAARNEGALGFAGRRVVRVVPMYIIATLLTLVVLAGHALRRPHVPLLVHLLKSLLFIPHYSLEHPDQIWPYLVPGWTLNFETFFYVIFAIGLAVRSPFRVSGAMLGLCVAAGLLFTGRGAVWSTYTDPQLLEFLLGLLIARHQAFFASRRAALLLPAGFTLLLLSDLVSLPRVLEWGVPAAMIVAGGVALEACGLLRKIPVLDRIGNASYSIYLFQVLAIAVSSRLVRAMPLHGIPQFVAMVMLSFAASLLLGITAYHMVERPMLGRLRARKQARLPVTGRPTITPADPHAAMVNRSAALDNI